MKLQQASSDKFDKHIRDYKERTLTQLQSIIPKWAYAKDSDNIFDIRLRPKTGEYLMFLVDTKELIKTSELHEVNTEILFTGNRLNDGRVAMILHRWDNNQFIDPPTVEIFDSNKSKIGFSDGRHRSKTSYLLGHIQIPIAIHKSQIDSISKMLRLIPV
ncbi:MAG: hypothetical protein ACLQQ4_12300 [Bacteroidia bacterium]